ncbi:MAG: hypothetical protein AB8B91_21880 [Rubripirellula sp.]
MSGGRRTGAAFLMLVVILLLVVVGATKSLIQREVADRGAEKTRLRARMMIAAVEAAWQTSEQTTALRLPVGQIGDAQEFVQVKIDRTNNFATASWHRGDQVVDQMKRPFQTEVQSE